MPDDKHIKWPIYTAKAWEAMSEDERQAALDSQVADLEEALRPGRKRAEQHQKDKAKLKKICADIGCSGMNQETCDKYPKRCSMLRNVILGPWT